jgi:hypothetical protein
MKLKPLLVVWAGLILTCLSASAQTLLTDYGSADSQAFTLFYADGSFTQGANTATWVTGSATNLIGTFTAVDLTSVGTPSSLQLNLMFNSSFSGSMDYVIRSSAGNQIGYSFSGAGLTGTQTVSFLRNASLDVGTILLSNVNRASLVTNDSANITLNTLSAVSAVPEPATCAALFGIASLGFCVLRKRRKA